MAVIEKFLGNRVSVPVDQGYFGKQRLWTKSNQEFIIFGLTELSLVLPWGINDQDWLVQDGQRVPNGETVIFCITGKIQDIDTPLEGHIHFNHSSKLNVPLISRDPYGGAGCSE